VIRTTTMSWIVAAALFLFAGILPCRAQQKLSGSIAPDFALTALDGKEISLRGNTGKVILLDFWATWCAPCQTEVPRFISFQNEFGKQGFQVIGISMDDTPEPVRKFYTKFKMNYPVAMGTEKVLNSYGGVLGLPLTYLIGRDGRIVQQYDGNANLDRMEDDIKRTLREGTNAER